MLTIQAPSGTQLEVPIPDGVSISFIWDLADQKSKSLKFLLLLMKSLSISWYFSPTCPNENIKYTWKVTRVPSASCWWIKTQTVPAQLSSKFHLRRRSRSRMRSSHRPRVRTLNLTQVERLQRFGFFHVYLFGTYFNLWEWKIVYLSHRNQKSVVNVAWLNANAEIDIVVRGNSFINF